MNISHIHNFFSALLEYLQKTDICFAHIINARSQTFINNYTMG